MRPVNIYLPLIIWAVWLMGLTLLHGQGSGAESRNNVFVDKQGILRWQETGEEVCNFGVNYTVPFAHAFRRAGAMNVDRKKAMEEDVYHMARLGLDGFRVHVWDCEISDTVGNLLHNEHLELFDYLIKLMKERGIKMILTPVAYWGNGYPEPEEDTPGFSSKYGKGNCLTDPGAIQAQETYLEQFVSHVNPYTGIAYAFDPDIIAFEICNEPHHGGTQEETRDFINRMVAAIKKTGTPKPVFYNVSHSIHLAGAYFSSDIQGGTFQWYPSGLVAGHELKGNFLPNVTHYHIPFDTVDGYSARARIVYEYDAADIGRSYIHPYMAKAFREAGMQFVAQFSYDPMFLAPFNTEYQTHFMNLAHAPQKAISLMIAGEVFRKLPLGTMTGVYPDDTIFDVFRVSYHRDLSEMVTEEAFLYTNHTLSMPPDPARLTRIAGCGSSPVVEYDGTGAYFLDRLDGGIWRLEVMPDAVWVSDPFEWASPRKEVSVIIHANRRIKISLPDLGNEFSVRGINDRNNFYLERADGMLSIHPGVYLLEKRGTESGFTGKDLWKNIRLGEYAAPASSCRKMHMIHHPPMEVTEGKSIRLSARVVSESEPESVELLLFSGWRPFPVPMEKRGPYTWWAEVPADRVSTGMIRYFIAVKTGEGTITFPAGSEGHPSEWDFYERDPYLIPVVANEQPLVLFDSEKDAGRIFGNTRTVLAPSLTPGEKVLQMNTRNLENIPLIMASRFFFGERICGRRSGLEQYAGIVLRGYALTEESFPLELALILDDGTAYGGFLEISPGKMEYTLGFEELEPVKSINLPRSFPGFQPFYSVGRFNQPFRIRKAESVQVSVGPGIRENERRKPYGIAIEKIYLK